MLTLNDDHTGDFQATPYRSGTVYPVEPVFPPARALPFHPIAGGMPPRQVSDEQRAQRAQDIWEHDQRLMQHNILSFLESQQPEEWASTPKLGPKAENAAPFERSTSWSRGISLMGTSLSLKSGMQKAMESGEYSDLTILCEDQKFSVHKVVVCSQSKVLAAAMKKGFKTKLTSLDHFQESELNVIDLSEDGILLVSNLVTFLYTGNYPAKSETSGIHDPTAYAECIDSLHDIAVRARAHGAYTSNVRSTNKEANPKVDSSKESPPYSLDVEMYALSDQYDIPALGALAKSRLDLICMIKWDSKSFLEIVPRVYESTLESNQGLRTVVLEHARKHSNDFMKDELLKASFNGLLLTIPEFSTALLNNYMTASLPSLENAGICAGWRLE